MMLHNLLMQIIRLVRSLLRPALLPLLLGISGSGAAAQSIGDRPEEPADTVAQRPATPDFDVFSFGLEFVPSPNSGSFFKEYPVLGGKGSLGGFVAPSFMLRLASGGSVRVVLYGAYSGGEFTDLYDVVDTVGPNRPLASIVENISLTSIPVMAGVEYAPVREQFTTYVGATAGGAYSTAEWRTTVRNVPNSGFARPATNQKGGSFHPVYRVYAGIDYRFDRNLWSRGPVRGIFLEGSYLGIPIRRDYFAAIRNEARGLPVLPGEDDGVIDLGGVTFTLGVNLQFVRN